MDKAQIVLMLIVLVAPLLVWGVREVFPRIPSLMLPAIATALGPLLDWLVALSTGDGTNPVIYQLAAGGAAVAVRELVDQAKKAVGAA